MTHYKRRHGLARVLSKLGVCSRTQAEQMIRAGRVSVDDRVERDPERPSDASVERVAVDDIEVRQVTRVYLALNKPRGIIVSAADERGRDTVYDLIPNAPAPWLAPVGRLDRASEGLLLLTNDSEWAAKLTAPSSGVLKTYHVQVEGQLSDASLERMRSGIDDRGERLSAHAVTVLRSGSKNCWLEVQLDAGRNRHIRRMVKALDHEVLRLIRIAIGPIELGTLAKGRWRALTEAELTAIAALVR